MNILTEMVFLSVPAVSKWSIAATMFSAAALSTDVLWSLARQITVSIRIRAVPPTMGESSMSTTATMQEMPDRFPTDQIHGKRSIRTVPAQSVSTIVCSMTIIFIRCTYVTTARTLSSPSSPASIFISMPNLRLLVLIF